MDWDRLRIFHIVADAGSFSHASEEINTSQSAISRQVSNLEYEVGMPLFHRHPRGLILTEQGELLYKRTRNIVDIIKDAEFELIDSKEKKVKKFMSENKIKLKNEADLIKVFEFYESL